MITFTEASLAKRIFRNDPVNLRPAFVSRHLVRIVLWLALGLAQLTVNPRSWAGPVAGRLYYSRFSNPPSVSSVDFFYGGGTNFTLTNKTLIATFGSADGLVVAPDGDLLVGSCGTLVYKVNPFTGKVLSRTANGGICHMALDPNRARAWGGFDYDVSGSKLLTEIPLTTFAAGIGHAVTGSTTAVGTLAWDTAGNAYYTDSPSTGTGSFGIINLNTFVTTNLLANLPAAHGMAFDPYTGSFVLFGAKNITQVQATTTNAVTLSNLSFPGEAKNWDQGTVDGLGHIFVANNDGTLLFIDYSASRLLSATNTTVIRTYLDSDLDDVAPVLLPGTTNVANLVLGVAAAPVPAQPRSNFTYTITVSNAGPAQATSLQLVTTPPANALFLSATSSLASCGLSNSQLICTVPLLPVGGTFVVSETLQPLGGSLSSRWVVSSAETDPIFSDNVTESSVFAPYDCAPTPAGLLASWGGEGNALDSVGTNHGVFTNAIYAPGLVGTAFGFDGNTTVIAVADNATSLRPAALTVECWANLSDVGNLCVLMSKPYGNAAEDSYVLVFNPANGLHGYGRLSSGATPNLQYNWSPTSGTWYHLAYTLSATNQALYLNGEQVASSLVNGSLVYDTHPHLIGADMDSGKVVYRTWGLIDEPSIYNRALTAAEIRAIYIAGAAGKCAGPVIAPASLNPGAVNQPYVSTLALLHATSPYSFTTPGVPPPSALTLARDGTLAGVPAAPGTNTFVVQATDGKGANTTASFNLAVLACQSRPAGLLGWWRGEANVLDELKQHNGGIGGNVQFAPGMAGKAFVFDGNSAYVGLGAWSPGTRWSVEAWVNPRYIADNARWVIAGGFADYKDWGIVLKDGQFATQFRGPTNGASTSLLSGVWPVAGSWYHVVGTCDGTNAAIYVNGTLRGTRFVATNYFGTAAGTRIGSSVCCLGNDDFSGLIDEVAIYNRALSAAEILTAYNAGAGGKCPGGTPPQVSALSGTHFSVNLGGTLGIQATGSGTGPLAYQWQFYGVPIPSATNAALTLTNVQPDQAGAYSLTVGNPFGSVTSANATVEVVSSAPGPIYWANWNSNAFGTITTPGGIISVAYAGEPSNLTNNYPSWQPAATFADGNIVSNAPPASGGALTLVGGFNGIDSITFSAPVLNPVMAVWSLGSPSNPCYLVFSGATPHWVAGGTSLEYSSGSSINIAGNSVLGIEGNGTMFFSGVFSSLTWANPQKQNFSGFTVGIPALASPAPMVTAVDLSTGTLQLTWTTVPGRTYQLQYSTNLTQAVWQASGSPVSPTNFTAKVSTPRGRDEKRFYRVILLP